MVACDDGCGRKVGRSTSRLDPFQLNRQLRIKGIHAGCCRAMWARFEILEGDEPISCETRVRDAGRVCGTVGRAGRVQQSVEELCGGGVGRVRIRVFADLTAHLQSVRSRDVQAIYSLFGIGIRPGYEG